MKTTETTNSPMTPRENRITRYCAAGLGAAVLTGAVTTADASIVFVNYNGLVVTDSAPGDGYFGLTSFDLNGDGVVDFRLGVGNQESFGGAAAIFAPTGGTLGVVGTTASGFTYPSKLAAGANIGPTAGFQTLTSTRGSLAFGAGYPGSKWATSTTAGYLGIRFTVNGQTDYGWLRLSVAANSTGAGARNITLLSAAYQTNGTAIAAGAVPEPSTTCLGLVALGAVGLAAHRRKRAAAKAETLVA